VLLKKLGLLSLLVMKCFSSDSLSLDELKVDEDLILSEKNSDICETNKNIREPIRQEKKNLKCCRFPNGCFYVEALPGYYYPIKEKRLREIYGQGWFSGQLDMGWFFCRKLALFLRGGASWDSGESTVLENKTRIVIGNITLGLKFVVPVCRCIQYYVGGGGRAFFLRVKNNSDFVQRKVSSNKIGGAFVTGFWFFPSKCRPVFLDLFFDYSFYDFHFKSSVASERNNLDVSGPTVGLGIGYKF